MGLERILRQKIKDDGPISVAEFMTLALGHPDHGYYMKKDPFGRGGDFITAPEVSQMFGEMIGVWVADVWIQMGRPEKFTLLECGPGRGTLMADLMRGTVNVDGFHDAVEIVLLEMSPVLKEKQAEALGAYDPSWIVGLDELDADGPVVVIGNEFLDALPVEQYVGDVERKIDVDGEGFCFVPAEGDIVEKGLAQAAFVKRIAKVSDAALFIDYGYTRGSGDTLQAVKSQEYCDVLEHIGDADITAHVDFGALAEVVPCLLIQQGAFLRNLGIELRATYLAQKGDEGAQAALQRLVGNDQMGQLFKVMGMRKNESITLAGF